VPSWSEVEAEAPELAARAREFFDVNKHKTLATLRRDGSPRISGTEVDFADGEIWLGSMWKAVKALDLRRDPRFAIHSGSVDPDRGWEGDAKLAGTVEEIDDAAVKEARGGGAGDRPYHLFRAEITELVVVSLSESRDRMVIESWHEGRGYSSRAALTRHASGAYDAADEHSGAEVAAQHRTNLRAEQRLSAEDRGAPGHQMLGVLEGLGVLDDPISRATVVQLIQVGAHPL
jgi:hypothetical protein